MGITRIGAPRRMVWHTANDLLSSQGALLWRRLGPFSSGHSGDFHDLSRQQRIEQTGAVRLLGWHGVGISMPDGVGTVGCWAIDQP